MEKNISCLYRISYHRFWMKLFQNNPDTGKIHGHKMIEKIKIKTAEYKKMIETQPESESSSPF